MLCAKCQVQFVDVVVVVLDCAVFWSIAAFNKDNWLSFDQLAVTVAVCRFAALADVITIPEYALNVKYNY